MRYRPRRRTPPFPDRRARRGIYILPSLLTVGNVFCGYFSLISASRGEFHLAAVLLLVSAVLDNLDGRVARLTRTTTDFGLQFDSLADIISFGIAPSFLVYRWGLLPLGRLGWAAAFLFVVCGAMRLARFNIQGSNDKRYFVGLPIPAAAMVLATLVFYRPEQVVEMPVSMAVCLLMMVLSGVMVSRLRYRSFKSGDVQDRRRSFQIVGLLALLLAAVAVDPQVVLLSLALIYMLSGLLPRRSLPVEERRRRWTWAARPLPEGPASPPEDDHAAGA